MKLSQLPKYISSKVILIGVIILCQSGMHSCYGQLNLFIQDKSLNCGDTIYVPIQVKNFKDMLALDFGLKWNPNALIYTNKITYFNPKINLTPLNVGPNDPNNDTLLTFTWGTNIPGNLIDNDTLFIMKFYVLGGGNSSAYINFVNEFNPIFGLKVPFVQVTIGLDSAKYIITDNIPPTIVCPASFTDTITPPGTQLLVTDASPISATDNCGLMNLSFTTSGATSLSGNGSINGKFLNKGTTNITYTATDGANLKTTCSFSITVVDTSSKQLTIYIQSDTTSCNSNSFKFHVKAKNYVDIAGLGFALTWDGQVFKFDSVSNFHPSLMINYINNFGPIPADNDTLLYNWFNFSGMTLPDDATMYTVYMHSIAPAAGNHTLKIVSAPFFPIEASIVGTPPTIVPVVTINGNLVVSDNISPTISCPPNKTIFVAPGQSNALVTGLTPNASDNCGIKSIQYNASGASSMNGNGTLSQGNFNVGTSTFTYTVTDFANNITTCSFLIQVVDTTLRIIAGNHTFQCSDSIVGINITSENFNDLASLQFGVKWNKNVLKYTSVGNFNSALTLTPSNFGLAPTMDTLLFTWANSNGVTVPSGVTLFTIFFDVVGNAGNSTMVMFTPAPLFPIEAAKKGVPPTLVTVLPINGTVNITDNISPTIICPSDQNISVPAGTNSVSVPNIGPITTDNCAIKSVTYTASGSSNFTGFNDASNNTFNYGTTTVTYIVTDNNNNQSTCAFKVNILQDSFKLIAVAPKVQCAGGDVTYCVTTENFDQITSLEFNLGWDDNVLQLENITHLNSTLNLNTLFNFGPNPIVDTLTFGYAFPGVGGISLADGDTLFCLDFTILSSNTQPVVKYVALPFTPIEASMAGNPLPIPIPVFTFDATLPIKDVTPPVIPCPNNLQFPNSPGLCGRIIKYPDFGITDNCALAGFTVDPPDNTFYNVGTTPVTVIATDASGNKDTCTFNIEIKDEEAPKISCAPVILYPTQEGCTATFTSPTFTITDNCAGAVITNVSIANDSILPIGNYSLTVTGIDANGNSKQCFTEVFVLDTVKPVIKCPQDVTVNSASDTCGYYFVGLKELEITDNCTPNITTLSTNPPDSTFFTIGDHFVTYFTVDASGNQASCVQKWTVAGEIATFINCPQDITVDGTSLCKVSVDWIEPSYSYNCFYPFVIEQTHSPGDTFQIGTTTVHYLLYLGNTVVASCSFKVIVQDLELPVFTYCPGDINLTLSPGNCDTIVGWDAPTFTDNCAKNMQLVQFKGPQPGGLLSLGIYEVGYKITDGFGNEAICEFTISICDDQTPIVISCPSDTVYTLDSTECSVVLSWLEPEFDDNCSNLLSITSNFNSGQSFPAGKYTVTYQASDPCGKSAACTFNIDVQDVYPPSITCPANVTVNTDGLIISDPDQVIIQIIPDSCGFPIIFYKFPEGSDNCPGFDVFPQNLQNPLPGELFAPGTYNMSFIVIDKYGNSATCTFLLTVLGKSGNIVANQTQFCNGEKATLYLGDYKNVTWTLPDGSKVVTDTLMINAFGSAQSGTYTAEYSVPGCPNTVKDAITLSGFEGPALKNDTITVTQNSPIVINELANDLINPNASQTLSFIYLGTGQVTLNPNFTFTFIPDSSSTKLLDTIVYTVCYSECPDLCEDALVVINLDLPDPTCKTFNYITPNGDDQNDFLIISCADPNNPKLKNSLIIFNEWGDEVYRASPYKNDWNGTYNGDPLPDGVYYYIFQQDENHSLMKGFITLFR